MQSDSFALKVDPTEGGGRGGQVQGRDEEASRHVGWSVVWVQRKIRRPGSRAALWLRAWSQRAQQVPEPRCCSLRWRQAVTGGSRKLGRRRGGPGRPLPSEPGARGRRGPMVAEPGQ